MTARTTPSDCVAPRHGFSLVELLLVLTVLLCAATAVWPRLEAWREATAFQECVDHVRDELQQARLAAIDTGHPVIVRHLVENRTLHCLTSAEVVLRSPFALPAGVVLRSATENRSAGRDSRGILVEFRPDGTASGRPLMLISEAGFTRELRVDRATGAVVVTDANPDRQGE